MKPGMFHFGNIVFGSLAALALSACSLFEPGVELKALTLDVAPRANDNTPIAVDFVAVQDPELLKLFSGMSARQWFAEREQLGLDYRKAFSMWGLELVPGQFLELERFPLSGAPAAGLLVFAGYNTPGVHRLRLDEMSVVQLRFESRDMRLFGTNERRYGLRWFHW
ncbi:type VI secretion protein [Azotobacter chroococcum]|uniref:Type VI secretion protein n=1 Tax=Azotobacter chroococcum TaxID=353 RepID=A0A4Q9VP80_9GAMM|nr:type VI secretion protein [Azotobacter chroococcum]NHN76982.1 type VI secretion protein [Azotobacter chroococcum]TBW36693.1 type VI secretion protein [Azotobacter chroococcum]